MIISGFPRSLLKFLAFALLFIATARFCDRHNCGFSFSSTQSTLPYDSRWETREPSAHALQSVNEILSQPFTLMGGGEQCYVFLGSDKTTILKLFKHNLSWLKEGRFKWQNPHLDPVLRSCKFAADELSELTGVFFAHLNRTDLGLPLVTIQDRQKISYLINLNDTEFVLQKRGELLCQRLQRQIARGEIEEAKATLQSTLFALQQLQTLGFINYDSAFLRNFGFADNNPCFLDIGSFSRDLSAKRTLLSDDSLVKKLKNLDSWLMRHYPELAFFLEQLLMQDEIKEKL